MTVLRPTVNEQKKSLNFNLIISGSGLWIHIYKQISSLKLGDTQSSVVTQCGSPAQSLHHLGDNKYANSQVPWQTRWIKISVWRDRGEDSGICIYQALQAIFQLQFQRYLVGPRWLGAEKGPTCAASAQWAVFLNTKDGLQQQDEMHLGRLLLDTR